MTSPNLQNTNFFSIYTGAESLCVHSKVALFPSLNIKSLFLFFSIFVSISNKKFIISAKRFKNWWTFTFKKVSKFFSLKISVLGLKMLLCLVKMTWKSIKSVEMAIITRMGLDTHQHTQSPSTNFQNITRCIFQTTANEFMIPMPSPELSNWRFRVNGQDGCSARLFLDLLDCNVS